MLNEKKLKNGIKISDTQYVVVEKSKNKETEIFLVTTHEKIFDKGVIEQRIKLVPENENQISIILDKLSNITEKLTDNTKEVMEFKLSVSPYINENTVSKLAYDVEHMKDTIREELIRDKKLEENKDLIDSEFFKDLKNIEKFKNLDDLELLDLLKEIENVYTKYSTKGGKH